MLGFIRQNAAPIAWGALLLAIGNLLVGLGTGNVQAVVAAIGALGSALLPAVVVWFTPKPAPAPPVARMKPYRPGDYYL